MHIRLSPKEYKAPVPYRGPQTGQDGGQTESMRRLKEIKVKKIKAQKYTQF